MKKYSKDLIALIQLERAIKLFFEEHDYISVITLAGASEEICRKILEREKKDSSVDKLRNWFKDKYPDAPENAKFFTYANHTRNSLKHFDDNMEIEVEIDQREAAYWLARAVMNYDWSHAILTKPLLEYISWMLKEIKDGNL
jgi:hypothetical protein